MSNEIATNNISLPETLPSALIHVDNVMQAFNLPREILASEEEIKYAWSELPREILRIPPELRNGLIVRMCVAASVGLFDGAINYIWNAVILSLRSRVKKLGLPVVSQTLGKDFDDNSLNEMMDSQLLELCYKIELLSEDGYFFLNQCRDIRNNFSSAHPSIAQIDDRELINFISRCCKYGLTDEDVIQGVNVTDFLSAVKGHKLDEDEQSVWRQRLTETFPAQRQLLIPTMMGIYCDPNSSETTRINALKLTLSIRDIIDERTKSVMIEQYNKYFVKGDVEKRRAARSWFEKLSLLQLLSTSEQHSIVKNACQNLLNAHQEFNNFYNEPPFAQRLCELSSSMKIPDSIQHEYVFTILMCYVGNPYGVSHSAMPYYEDMIRNFSPKEIDYMLNLTATKSLFSMKVESYLKCRCRYVDALEMIETVSMNSSQLFNYNQLLKKYKK